jgi:predicted branched-subunit amino acid permease
MRRPTLPPPVEEFLNGARAALPTLVGLIPFGLVVALASAHAGLSYGQVFGFSTLVFAGSAQLVVTKLIEAGTAPLVAIASGIIINLRFVIYSISLFDSFRSQNAAKSAVMAHLINDQAYSVTHVRKAHGASTAHLSLFYLGAAFLIFAVWQTTMGIGMSVAKSPVFDYEDVGYVVALSFVALLAPLLKGKATWTALCVGATFSALVQVPLNANVLLATILGTAAGWAVQRWQ